MIKLFTHTDKDGIGCAVLAKLAFGDDVHIEYCEYDDINSRIIDFITSPTFEICNMIYITDISITESTVTNIVDRNIHNIKLLDHHDTANYLNKYHWCRVISKINDRLTCGTELFYDYLIGHSLLRDTKVTRKFVEDVRLYDTWDWTNAPDGMISKKVNDLLMIYGRDKFIDWVMKKIRGNNFPNLNTKELELLERHQEEIDQYIYQCNNDIMIRKDKKYKFGVVIADKYISELGNKLCSYNPTLDYVAIINFPQNSIHFRTNKNNIHLGNDIAKKYGGGGHAKTARAYINYSKKYQAISHLLGFKKSIFDLFF